MGRFGINMVQEKHHIGSGNGYLKMGFGWKDLQDMGSLEGNTSVVISREYIEVYDGQPLVVIDKHVTREGARIQTTLKEKRLRDIAWQLGLLTGDAIASEAIVAAQTVTEEQKVLFNTSWAHLDGTNIAAAGFTCTDGAPSGTIDYDESIDSGVTGDFVLDRVRGLIRRTAVSTIPDGGRTYNSYTWAQPKRLTFTYGQDNGINAFKLRFVYTQIDGNRQITDFFNALPAENVTQGYNVGGLNTRDMAFDALADVTMSPGQRLYRQYHEGATA
jgi:hypothetical protein